MSKVKQVNFLQIYEIVHDQFERFCRARVYGEMEYSDLMNETLLVAYDRFEAIDPNNSFLSFLCGTAIRLLANSHRKMRPKVGLEIYTQIPLSKNKTEQDMEVELLHYALSQLNNEQKESIILFEINGFSIKEIATMHEATESAVKQRLKRGRTQLKKILSFEDQLQIKKEVKNG